ncbi:hypothetical protein J4455_04685 [Candidatus Woesearchaeota archaeon]|nr:hypothetical protein [Candidatus Woesearchaeota archaeon]
MIRVLIDTNFIVTCLKFKIDLFSEINRICDFNYELYTIDKTLDELKKLKSKLSLQLIEKFNIKIIKTNENLDVDSLILKIADENTIVATQDKELKKKLRIKGIKVLVIRKKQYLMII